MATQQDELARAFALVEAELRRLDVERVHFSKELVTLTTREVGRNHWHGEAETLLGSVRDLASIRRTK